MAILLIYRPGSEAATDAFFTELAAYVEVFALYKCHILVAGDFNIHVERAEATDTVRLHNLLESCDCIQQIPFTPTHRDGGILDLVITKSEQILEKITVNPPGVISEHSVISWHCPLDIQPTAIMKRKVRGWTKLDQEGFRTALLTSELCFTEKRPTTAEGCFALYHSVLLRLADEFAPVRRVTLRRQRLALWMDDECRRLRRTSRRLERRYKRSRLTDDRRLWVEHERKRSPDIQNERASLLDGTSL